MLFWKAAVLELRTVTAVLLPAARSASSICDIGNAAQQMRVRRLLGGFTILRNGCLQTQKKKKTKNQQNKTPKHQRGCVLFGCVGAVLFVFLFFLPHTLISIVDIQKYLEYSGMMIPVQLHFSNSLENSPKRNLGALCAGFCGIAFCSMFVIISSSSWILIFVFFHAVQKQQLTGSSQACVKTAFFLKDGSHFLQDGS